MITIPRNFLPNNISWRNILIIKNNILLKSISIKKNNKYLTCEKKC